MLGLPPLRRTLVTLAVAVGLLHSYNTSNTAGLLFSLLSSQA